MCKAKPGMRCAGHARKRMQDAEQRFADSIASGDVDEAMAATEALKRSQWDYASTSEGRKHFARMKRSAAHANNGVMAMHAHDVLAAGELMSEQRTMQAEFMPSDSDTAPYRKPGSTQLTDDAAKAVAVLAEDREQYAFAATSDRMGHSAETQAAMDQHADAIRRVAAEWGWRGPDGATVKHCPSCGGYSHGPQDCHGIPDPRTPRRVDFPARWNALADAAADGDTDAAAQLDALAVEQAAHGHAQCHVCGQFRSIRYDSHQCPGKRVLGAHGDSPFGQVTAETEASVQAGAVWDDAFFADPEPSPTPHAEPEPQPEPEPEPEPEPDPHAEPEPEPATAADPRQSPEYRADRERLATMDPVSIDGEWGARSAVLNNLQYERGNRTAAMNAFARRSLKLPGKTEADHRDYLTNTAIIVDRYTDGQEPPLYQRRAMVDQFNQMLAHRDAMDPLIAEANAALDPHRDEFKARGGWNRAWLSVSDDGHVHRGTDVCGSLTPGKSRVQWLTDYSGKSEDEIVKAAGWRACTKCYPSAPLGDQRSLPTQMFSDEEKATAAAREKRERDRIARLEKEQAASITAPDGSPLRDRYQHVYRNERTATIDATDSLTHMMSWGQTDNPEHNRRVMDEDRNHAEAVIDALAAKHNRPVAEVRAELMGKATAKAMKGVIEVQAMNLAGRVQFAGGGDDSVQQQLRSNRKYVPEVIARIAEMTGADAKALQAEVEKKGAALAKRKYKVG